MLKVKEKISWNINLCRVLSAVGPEQWAAVDRCLLRKQGNAREHRGESFLVFGWRKSSFSSCVWRFQILYVELIELQHCCYILLWTVDIDNKCKINLSQRCGGRPAEEKTSEKFGGKLRSSWVDNCEVDGCFEIYDDEPFVLHLELRRGTLSLWTYLHEVNTLYRERMSPDTAGIFYLSEIHYYHCTLLAS